MTGASKHDLESVAATKPASSSEGQQEEENKDWSCWQLLLMLLNGINHVLVLLVTGYMVYLTSHLTKPIDYHVLLCTLGYVLFMSEAIVSLGGTNLWSRFLSRRTNSHLHWILQVLGALCFVAGVIVIYLDKQRHFRSVHAKLGIASVGAAAFIFLSGVVSLFAFRLRKLVKPLLSKFTHNTLGLACFAVGIAAQCYGYKKHWMVTNKGDHMKDYLIAATAGIALISVIGALRTWYGQLKGLVRPYL
ncbi:unnamed protein product [Trichogramma brassicae]|uniref:ascorbate ferrireductase (transmembrane) n=1 Tax=Trichogramma brassicae TaxID=86971 RepID=A0A6H5I7A8_9HYME|nr:unnamed protein product [Trichogramma brassicae]